MSQARAKSSGIFAIWHIWKVRSSTSVMCSFWGTIKVASARLQGGVGWTTMEQIVGAETCCSLYSDSVGKQGSWEQGWPLREVSLTNFD